MTTRGLTSLNKWRKKRHCPLNLRGSLAGMAMTNLTALLLMTLLMITAPIWSKALASPANTLSLNAASISYQGRLFSNSGTPLNGAYDITFSLYDALQNGNRIWGPENHAAVPVSDGLFDVGIGSQTPGGVPVSVWSGNRYLEISVDGETLSPREPIRSVPIAGMSLTVPDGVITSVHVQDGALGPADFTAFSGEAHDYGVIRGTTSGSPVNYGSTSLTFNLPYRAKVYIYLRGSVENPNGGCMLAVAVDGAWAGDGSLYLETTRTGFQTAGTMGVLTMEAGNHTLRPQFRLWSGSGTCNAATVAYGYIVLGQAP